MMPEFLQTFRVYQKNDGNWYYEIASKVEGPYQNKSEAEQEAWKNTEHLKKD